MTAPLSDDSSSSSSAGGDGAGVADGGGAGVGGGVGVGGAGVMTTVSVFDVTVATEGATSFTSIVRPDAASFSTKAVVNSAAKDDDLVGSASVSWTPVAT